MTELLMGASEMAEDNRTADNSSREIIKQLLRTPPYALRARYAGPSLTISEEAVRRVFALEPPSVRARRLRLG